MHEKGMKFFSVKYIACIIHRVLEFTFSILSTCVTNPSYLDSPWKKKRAQSISWL